MNATTQTWIISALHKATALLPRIAETLQTLFFEDQNTREFLADSFRKQFPEQDEYQVHDNPQASRHQALVNRSLSNTVLYTTILQTGLNSSTRGRTSSQSRMALVLSR